MKYDDESMIFLLVASSLMEFLCEWNHPALRMGTFCESHGVLSVLGLLEEALEDFFQSSYVLISVRHIVLWTGYIRSSK